MTTAKVKYGTSDQAITITIVGLADTTLRESDSITNASNLFLDVFVGGKLTTGTSPAATGQFIVYVYATVDGGTTWTSGATGSDAAFAPDAAEKNNLFLLGVASTDVTNDQVYELGPFSVASAFGGVMPEQWGIVVENDTGATVNATPSNHDLNYQGIHMQSTA